MAHAQSLYCCSDFSGNADLWIPPTTEVETLPK
jgi:hypothetical protein